MEAERSRRPPPCSCLHAAGGLPCTHPLAHAFPLCDRPAGIGFSTADVKLDRLPGWEPHSYGYHGDDGHAFSGRGTGRAYGPVYTTGEREGQP